MILKRTFHRIPMAEVDAAQVIYYASPYLWRESIFTSWLAEVGHPLRDLLERGLGTPCVASSAKYLRPLRLDHVVTLELRSGKVGDRSFDLGLDVIDAAGQLVGQVETTNVWVKTRSEEQPSELQSLMR